MNKGVYHTDVNIICHNKNVTKWNINIMDCEICKILSLLSSLCIKVWKRKVYLKIICQIRQSNTNISSCGFSNTNTNTNTDICVFKYKYKYKYVFDPSPGSRHMVVSRPASVCRYHLKKFATDSNLALVFEDQEQYPPHQVEARAPQEFFPPKNLMGLESPPCCQAGSLTQGV